MGLIDAFNSEDRVQVKFSDFYALMKEAASAEVHSQFMRNVIKCEIPYRYVREMLTGNSEAAAPQATGADGSETIQEGGVSNDEEVASE